MLLIDADPQGSLTASLGYVEPDAIETTLTTIMMHKLKLNLEYRFYKAYGMEIEDKRTVYGECTYRLVSREDEPSVCLMHDWIYLPSA